MGSEFHDDFSEDTTKHRGRGNQTTFSSKLFILELLVFTTKPVSEKAYRPQSWNRIKLSELDERTLLLLCCETDCRES